MAPPPWSASDRSSFAFESTVRRWPTILTSVIDHLNKLMHPLKPNNEDDSLRIAEAKSLISRIGELKYEIAHDRKLKPIPPDSEINLDLYNSELRKLQETGNDTWFSGPWLFNEAYMYRLVRSFFTQTLSWKDHDPFAKQKNSTLRSSASSVYRMASLMQNYAKQTPNIDPAQLKAEFLTLAHASLWGNATDLSLLTNLTHAQIQKLQETREDDHEKILQNDIADAWDYIQTLKNATIDLILDNAGFELYTDLVWMDWMVSCTPFVAKVIIHPKTIPWFVSDVVPEDFTNLLDSLQDVKFFPDNEEKSARDDLNSMISRWRHHISTGKWKLSVPHDLPLGQDVSLDKPEYVTASWWTNPLPYWEIADRSKDDAGTRALLNHLGKSDLSIWKGDLNYRRLTGDLCWDTTTPFSTAVGALAGKFPILALRTCKADVVVGLPPGKAETLDQTDPRWRVSGQYVWCFDFVLEFGTPSPY